MLAVQQCNEMKKRHLAQNVNRVIFKLINGIEKNLVFRLIYLRFHEKVPSLTDKKSLIQYTN